MVFWFRRSSTKHVVIKYTRKFTLLLCCLFLIDGILLRFCNKRSLLISQNACIIDHNYDGGLHKHTCRYHRSYFDKLVHSAGSETCKTLSESSLTRIFGCGASVLILRRSTWLQRILRDLLATVTLNNMAPTHQRLMQLFSVVERYLKSGFEHLSANEGRRFYYLWPSWDGTASQTLLLQKQYHGIAHCHSCISWRSGTETVWERRKGSWLATRHSLRWYSWRSRDRW